MILLTIQSHSVLLNMEIENYISVFRFLSGERMKEFSVGELEEYSFAFFRKNGNPSDYYGVMERESEILISVLSVALIWARNTSCALQHKIARGMPETLCDACGEINRQANLNWIRRRTRVSSFGVPGKRNARKAESVSSGEFPTSERRCPCEDPKSLQPAHPIRRKPSTFSCLPSPA